MAFGKRKAPPAAQSVPPPPAPSAAPTGSGNGGGSNADDVDFNAFVRKLLAQSDVPVVVKLDNGVTISSQVSSAPFGLKPAPQRAVHGFANAGDLAAARRVSDPLLNFMIDRYRDERDCHVETLFAAMAALTGEFALYAGAAAHGQTVPRGQGFIVGGLADPYLYGGDTTSKLHVYGLICEAAERAGANRAHFPDPIAIVKTVTIAIRDRLPYPPRPAVPDANMPLEWSPNACPRHRKGVIATLEDQGVTGPEMITLALGCAMADLIDSLCDDLRSGQLPVTPNALVQLAADVMIAVARMDPLEREQT